ncbi:hypothetical protein [Marinobacter litoralis]|uniref:hypothetical protein n=1 Tax=Marinobacter litoralis TaxID=187981 RepID=UPI0018EB0834|nr:hypothetical protein [Marinobacter litoralis]MBJ6137692.1 hypothetical protein [Marinobacter litoralis]
MISPINRRAQCVSTLVCTLFASTTAMAVPNITGVSQVSDSPPTLLVTGSGFTEKNRGAPLYYFNFENGSKNQSKLSFITKPLAANGTITSQTTPTGEGNVLKYRISDDYREVAIPRIEISPAPDKLYLYFHRRYDFSIGDSSTWGPMGFNLKVNRLWGSDGNNIYLGYQGKEGANSARIYAEYTAEGGSVWPGSQLGQVKDEWTQEEIIYSSSGVNVKNGQFDFIRNGILPYSRTWRMRTSDRSSMYDEIYFDQISNGANTSQDLNIYYDNIYIDDSHHRIYVSESPTFSNAKKRLIQVPISWDNNSIQFAFSPGGSSVDSLYVYVADKDGKINEKGARICQNNCPQLPTMDAPPAAPDLSIE